MFTGYDGLSPFSAEERPPLPGSPVGFDDSLHENSSSRPGSALRPGSAPRPGSGKMQLSPLRSPVGSLSGSFSSPGPLSLMQSSGVMMSSMIRPLPLGSHRQLHTGALDPSLPVSPRAQEIDLQEDRPAPHLGGCQILLPSWGAANDSMRIRNNGRMLRRKIPLMPMMPRLVERRLLEPELIQSLSEPSLPSASSTCPPSVSMQARMLTAKRDAVKTPRIMRGTVRKASKVAMHYPELYPYARPEPEISPRSNLSSTARSAQRKTVSWADKKEALPSGRNMHELAQFARGRSMRMVDAMYYLRRAGKEADGEEWVPEAPAAAPAPAPKMSEAERLMAMAKGEVDVASEEPKPSSAESGETAGDSGLSGSPKASPRSEKEMTLMNGTLTNLNDTEADLRNTEKMLLQAFEPVCDYGGAMHPTTIISKRTLSVVRRKAELLHMVEERLQQLRDCWKNRERLANEVAAGGSAPPEMMQVRKFWMMYVHKDNLNNICEPIDADKSNFESFCSSFGLPRQHASFEECRFIAKELSKWWSQEALNRAMKEAHPDIIARLMAVVENIGTEKGDDAEVQATMGEAREILGDMLAEKVLKTAKALKEKDEFATAAAPDMPVPEKARGFANQIIGDIKQAVALGTPTKHKSLQEAKQIASWFEAEEKNRIALRALKNAEKIQAKDAEFAETFEKREGFPPVGPGAEAAQKVEQEIKKAKELGVREEHATLAEVKEIASELKQLDGERKRLANRAKRMAAEAKKSAAGD
mmetsp:Transcript_147316/g.274467  ORF Transcript_147316/g.274467 Transcript_147316/m.274467 type:complete len:758 (+) Transcript_147316:109-2382(+)